METLHTLFYFIIAVGLLIAIHEFGHFWVARKTGVKVLRFSIGFGKIVWSYQKSPETTEYALSVFPLGGYVKMVDEREGNVAADDLPYAFNRQALWVRSAIVVAGPLFNLALAVMLFWLVLVLGETGFKPILGTIEPNTIAASANFKEGDEILTVNGKTTPTWTEAMNAVITSALDGQTELTIKVKTLDEREELRVVNLTGADSQSPEALYKRLGFNPWAPKLKPIIGELLPEGAAMVAGLKKGDLVLTVDDVAINDWMQWVETVKKAPGKSLNVKIERDGVLMSLTVIPKPTQVGDTTEGKIGAMVLVPENLLNSVRAEYSLPMLEAIPVAFETTYYYSVTTVKMIGKMLVGRASVENLSGPISIAQLAGQTASLGFVPFIKFLGLVSVSLGVLNLLPIPMLDGGHLMFYAIEGIKGKPVSEKVQLAFQHAGLAVLLTLMALAMVLDIQRLF
ncbi:RIP metalloprotease RseP [Methylocucumis oryzae]|uniref:Zinc metalloprotease n=1 Tax=Methylocucumis oryzae TaxID=1632867 RepID=A0A0F3IM43_9GAMM|nr:RIP metalloprotease RseP [Methylocucumis oryzae]KJV07845.1 peptidase [Methylocucumis oryzae]